MIELTEEQRRELAKSAWPPEVVDPKTGEAFVLIHKAMFERVRSSMTAIGCRTIKPTVSG